MKKIYDFVRKTLTISPSEARGVVFIFLGMIVLIIIPFLSDYFFSKTSPTNAPIFASKNLDSLAVSLEKNQDSKNTSENSYTNYEHSNYKEYPKKPAHYFPFNPNTASVEQLQEVGIPKFLANRIEHYRSKGGKFRKKEDLAKIYDFSEELYDKLAPYIQLPANETENHSFSSTEITENKENFNKNNAVEKPTSATVNSTLPSTYTKKNPQRFDMNLADTTALKNINGIGSGYAKRIIKFRDLLGGFANAEQVKETYGLPPETADELLKYGFIKTPARKIKLNEATSENLKHPYLKYFQAKAIISYREQHGKFKSIDELKNIKVLDENTLTKLAPYLEF